MPISAKTVRAQINLLKPIVNSCSLKTARKGQDKIGELMESRNRHDVIVKKHSFTDFDGAWVLPRDERRNGVVLYLHGGGYTCGSLEYALGFGSALASRTGSRVFCAAYRLAPENKFPAAVDDALKAYKYILSKGHEPSKITLCGESAGGGLCYALCLRLKRENLPLPCGIIAISPWTDLTLSGESYEYNKQIDPCLSRELISFYSKCYTDTPENPEVSPVFGDLSLLPPSLIMVGSDEILLSDSQMLHECLLKNNCQSRLLVAKDRWHGYLLYGLYEDEHDWQQVESFLSTNMSKERKMRWLRLDNAAKIYPAARRANWSNVYRASIALKEDVDKEVLQSALDVTARRFPSMMVRLRKGMFWFYLQQVKEVPPVMDDYSYPLTRMSKKEMSRHAFRIIVHKNRISLEFFHSLTDGVGALTFLKTLAAEYLQQKHGVYIPAEKGVLGRLQEPSEKELEDSFQKHAGAISADRREKDAWRITGTEQPGGIMHVTYFTLDFNEIKAKAKEYGVGVTNFMCAVMMEAIQQLQKEKIPEVKRRKPIRLQIPVNLRPMFGSETLRNFALYITPEILPKLGEYSFEEICQIIKHSMGLEITPKQMSMKIAVNVNSEKIMAVRLMPLFIKNIIMKAVFDTVGEVKSCLSMSNLGNVDMPSEMAEYVDRVDVVLSVQSKAPYNCGVISYGGKTYVSFIRNIKESELEYHFFKVLQRLGLSATVESNRGSVGY